MTSVEGRGEKLDVDSRGVRKDEGRGNEGSRLHLDFNYENISVKV